MDGTVRLRGFDNSPHLQDNWKAVCCTQCGYDMGYDHVNTTGMEQSIDHVICPECFTKQYKTAANYAPDSWRETNAATQNSMADQADHQALNSDTETFQIYENVSGHRIYNFEFPTDLSWEDVDHHDFDWSRQQILIRWMDGSETRFDIGYGELEDLEETGEASIFTSNGDQLY